MQINGITPLEQSVLSIGQDLDLRSGSVAGSGSGSFGSTIQDLIESVDKQQTGAEFEIARTVAGDAPDLHRTIAALQAADLSFQFALQVRNKVIGAYEEIMRMQV